MKRVFVFALLFIASVALMAQNTAVTEQTGNSNTATVDQVGSLNEGYVTQTGNSNDAVIDQNNAENIGVIDQLNGDQNGASVTQDGTANEAYVTQGMVENYNGLTSSNVPGNNNNATVTQSGTANMVGELIQVGDGNTGSVSQSGSDNLAYAYQGWAYGFWGETAVTSALSSYSSFVNIAQSGSGNYGAVWQYGGSGNDVSITQNTGSNTASVAQGFIYEDGAYDFTYPVYNTSSNHVSIQQIDGMDNFGKVFQLGDGNQFDLVQTGDNNSVGYDASLSGLVAKRNAYFTQDGDDNEFVGTQEDGATLDYASFQHGNENKIDLEQGEDDFATIQQDGNLNVANLMQDGGAHIATITQSGNSNTSNVTQQQ